MLQIASAPDRGHGTSADDLLRRVSDDAVGVRFDPEPYVGGARPWAMGKLMKP